MKNILILFAASVFLYSCGTAHPVRISKTTTYKKPSAGTKHTNVKVSSDRNNNTQAGNILSDAEKYLGAPYKPGGMTSSGFDCSGFVNTVFAENDIKLTRRSSDQAKEGRDGAFIFLYYWKIYFGNIYYTNFYNRAVNNCTCKV